MMIEDLPANLKPAKEMGMTTCPVIRIPRHPGNGWIQDMKRGYLDLVLLERIDPAPRLNPPNIQGHSSRTSLNK
jgi:FMN phosphatase YigB (HAD superfamily)